MLHNASTQHLSHLFSDSGGLVGLAKKRSSCHGFSTAPVSPPFLNPSEKYPLISGIRKIMDDGATLDSSRNIAALAFIGS